MTHLYRQMLMRALAEVDGVEVIDVACDGVEAIEKIERLQPDLVTLDVQMPKLDGLGVLREVSRRSLKTTILMVSSVTAEGAPATVDALLNGAMDCILKPSGVDAKEERHELRNALADRVEAILLTMSEAEPRYNVPQSTAPQRAASNNYEIGRRDCCWCINGWPAGVENCVAIVAR